MQEKDKIEIYKTIEQQIMSVLSGETDTVAQMASVSALLSCAIPYYYWTGFYRINSKKLDELIIGPYQGTLGCLRIPIGQGVCGTAAKNKKTLIVKDVHLFEGHIACDPKSASEIVVPVLDQTSALIGVLDIDSTEKAAFDEIDAKYLEEIVKKVFAN